jgi:thiol:disulfide interchange protein DsbC
MIKTLQRTVLLLCALALAGAAIAQEAVIRKNIGERFPALKGIDEVTKAAVPGWYEVRYNGTEIFYTDSQGNYILHGELIDTRSRRNLTEERIDKLTAIKFDDLPFNDAFTIVRGNGQRKLAVFEDPNCGYCKRFERDLQKVDNVTIYMFLFPILGASSTERSKAVWCAKDRSQAWIDWMVRDVPLTPAASGCDTAVLTRNVELGRNFRINATPTLVFADGARAPGAIDAGELEKRLAAVK